jgi:hypothetical protein
LVFIILTGIKITNIIESVEKNFEISIIDLVHILVHLHKSEKFCNLRETSYHSPWHLYSFQQTIEIITLLVAIMLLFVMVYYYEIRRR